MATARKLVVIAWYMLRHGEPHRYAQPFQTREKLARLRRATGSAKRRGTTKRSPRSAAYGSGKRTRAVPTLAEANAAEGVPAPRLLTPGEQAMLQLHGVTPYAASLQTARRESRAPRKDARERELGG